MAGKSSWTTAAFADVAMTCGKAIMWCLGFLMLGGTLVTAGGVLYFAISLKDCDLSCDEDTPGVENLGEGYLECDGANSNHPDVYEIRRCMLHPCSGVLPRPSAPMPQLASCICKCRYSLRPRANVNRTYRRAGDDMPADVVLSGLKFQWEF